MPHSCHRGTPWHNSPHEGIFSGTAGEASSRCSQQRALRYLACTRTSPNCNSMLNLHAQLRREAVWLDGMLQDCIPCSSYLEQLLGTRCTTRTSEWKPSSDTPFLFLPVFHGSQEVSC